MKLCERTRRQIVKNKKKMDKAAQLQKQLENTRHCNKCLISQVSIFIPLQRYDPEAWEARLVLEELLKMQGKKKTTLIVLWHEILFLTKNTAKVIFVS